MIDKNDEKNSEEYHLGDEDLLAIDVNVDNSSVESAPKMVPEKEGMVDKKTVVDSKDSVNKNFEFLFSMGKQNKLVVLGGVFGLFIMYSFISWMWQNFSSNQITKKEDKVVSTKVVKKEQPAFQDNSSITGSSSVQTQPQLQPNVTADINNRLSQISSDEMKTQADLQTASSNILSMQSNINQLIQKISEMEKNIDLINQNIDSKIKQMNLIKIKQSQTKHKKSHNTIHKATNVIGIYIQAIIPGRAWLIDQNGANTITVREGTKIPGHGVVRVIDPNQGQVVLSTGEIIKFGQWDS